MNPLLENVIKAHGGLKQWDSFRKFEAKISIGGAAWQMVGAPDLLRDIQFEANVHDQDGIRISNIGGHGETSVFSKNKVTLLDSRGNILEERPEPRSSFLPNRPWDHHNVAYFASYATWNYLSGPFLFTLPGFVTEEVGSRRENGETWRGLKVTYPADIAAHTKEQVLYYGEDGLLRRQDYSVDVMGGAQGANYASDYKSIHGIFVPMKRRIYGRDPSNNKVPEPVLISIDVNSFKFIG